MTAKTEKKKKIDKPHPRKSHDLRGVFCICHEIKLLNGDVAVSAVDDGGGDSTIPLLSIPIFVFYYLIPLSHSAFEVNI